MKNKYVSFISDEHLLKCIENLHKSYVKAKNNISKKNLYANKVDTIKLTFDAKFNNIDEESLIQAEILRQIDKSINNSIRTFHEQVLGGVKGYQVGTLSGFDIKAKDDSLFGIFKFEHLPKNIEDCVFEKLTKDAQVFNKAKFYLVDFTKNEKHYEKWIFGNEEYKVSHKNVFKISGHSFYELVSGEANSLTKILKFLQTTITNSSKFQFSQPPS